MKRQLFIGVSYSYLATGEAYGHNSNILRVGEELGFYHGGIHAC